MAGVTLPRFHAPDLDPARALVVLSPEESHHLVRVMRLVAGDEVVVFDGRGHGCRARVERADRQRATLRIIETLQPAAESAVPIVLVQAVLKGDKMDDVVRDATMAGVRRIVPIVSDRSQVRLSALKKGHAVDRWQRIAIASAKQCGQLRLPAIDAPQSFEEWLSSSDGSLRLLLTEPSSSFAPLRTLPEILAGPHPLSVNCIVGPEGGWSLSEHHAATAAGCVALTLGSMTFRADAAGLIVVSIVTYAIESTL
jgi:16S rRNA (uracil1498-N3)-methyltransferase